MEGVDLAYAPRRTVLDALLLEAAREAGAEVREGQHVDGLVIGADGSVRGIRTADGEITARIVIGADGRNSHVAKAVRATEYHTKPRLQYSYYTFFDGLPTHGMETYVRPDRGFALIPTHDDLTLIVLGWPYAEARAYKADVAGNFRKTLELVPEVAARVARARQVAPFLGGAVPGWFRKPFGPGWALVGDAGYSKDPITAQGITDAFLGAERLCEAVDGWLGDGRPYDDVMGAWQQERDAKAAPIYEFTSQMATLEPPPPELAQLLGAVAGNQEAMDGFVSVLAGSVSPVEFFSEENVARIFAAAGPAEAFESVG